MSVFLWTRSCRPLREHNVNRTPTTAERKKNAVEGYFRGVYKTQQEAAVANAVGTATVSREVRRETMAGRSRTADDSAATGPITVAKTRANAINYAVDRMFDAGLGPTAAAREANKVRLVDNTSPHDQSCLSLQIKIRLRRLVYVGATKPGLRALCTMTSKADHQHFLLKSRSRWQIMQKFLSKWALPAYEVVFEAC